MPNASPQHPAAEAFARPGLRKRIRRADGRAQQPVLAQLLVGQSLQEPLVFVFQGPLQQLRLQPALL
ncbi:MAG TPA: hypothetical protein VF690_03895 [Hymenobacter sp.]